MRVVARSSLTPTVPINCIREENGVTLVKYSAQQPDWAVQHDDARAEAEAVSPMVARQHLSVFRLTQRLEVCEFGSDTSAGTMSERAPMLNVSAANNNRADSFIGYSLSPVGTSQRRFWMRR
jgi:hypothetical protein